MAFVDSMGVAESTEWGTPGSVYDPLAEVYAFTLDGAASHDVAATPPKCDRWCTPDGTFALDRCTCATPERFACVVHDPRLADLPRFERGCDGRATVQIDERDGLRFPWRDERVFLNPPWGPGEGPCESGCKRKSCRDRGWHAERYLPGIADFLRKARDESLRYGVLVVAIGPARTDNGWWHTLVAPWSRVRLGQGRVKFVDPQGAQRVAAGLKPRTGPPVGIFTAVYR